MEEEVSLREIINIVWKQKWIIVIVTIACMLLSAVVSLFVLKPTYETYSIVRMQSASQEGDKAPTDIKTFLESLKSSSTLNSLIEKNKLDRSVYTINSVRGMFKLEAVSESNLMKITVRGNNAEKVSQMANMLAFELGVRIEIADRTKVIVDSQKKLDDLGEQIAIAKERLNEAQNQLKNTPEKQITTRSLSEDDYLRSVVQEKSNSGAKGTGKLEMNSESINPVYNDLQAKVAQAKIDLNALLKEEQNNKSKIETNTKRIHELEQKPTNDRLDENKSVQILDGTNAIFVDPSIQPDKPVGPKVVLNIIIAAVLGGMLSLLFVFLMQYMRETARSQVNV